MSIAPIICEDINNYLITGLNALTLEANSIDECSKLHNTLDPKSSKEKLLLHATQEKLHHGNEVAYDVSAEIENWSTTSADLQWRAGEAADGPIIDNILSQIPPAIHDRSSKRRPK